MMRIIITALWVGLTCFLGSPASADVPITFRGEVNSLSYTHLTDTNQSQIFEPMSVSSLSHYPQLAKVRFIVASDSGLNFDNVDFNNPGIDQCKNSGYSTLVSSCTAAGKIPGALCAYDGDYTNECYSSAYKYKKAECSYPRTLSNDSCGGKYKCYCDRTLFPYGADKQCAALQEFEISDSCVEDGKTYYGRCRCPAAYVETCTALNQQGKGTACTLNSVSKYTSCQCKAGYNLTCSETGPATPTDYCSLGGIKYYKNCKDCSAYKYTSCPAPLKPSSEICGGKLKCSCDRAVFPYGSDKQCAAPQVFETSDACTEESGTYYSKCKCPGVYAETCTDINQQGKGTGCPVNGVSKYTACECKAGYSLTCDETGPASATDYCDLGGTKYYKTCKDCSTYKYTDANCNLALVGEACGGKYAACKAPILYSDKTVSTEVLSGKTPIAVVFDVPNKLALALDHTDQLEWSWSTAEIPALEKCTTWSCAPDGKQNTAAIIALAQANNLKHPAAEYCFSYKPTNVNTPAAWFAAGKWFLPSIKELNTLYQNKAAVNETLAKLNAAKLESCKNYWSSIVLDKTNAWYFVMGNRNTGTAYKLATIISASNCNLYTRAVLSY